MRSVPENRIDDVARVLRGAPGLRLVVIFGSTARGTSRPDSDIDVGIVPADPEMPLGEELELSRRLEEGCGRAVHLVRLDRASTLLRWRVAREGRLLVSEPGNAWPRFVATSAIEHAEIALQLARAEERFRARVAESRRA